MGKTKVIAFANNKGGSGKSTTCSNVGYAMTLEGKRVLLIDGDMQMNLTLSFFPEDRALEIAKSKKNLYHALRAEEDLSEYIIPTAYTGLDIVPSTTLMSSIEYDLFTKWEREQILSRCLEKVIASESYDYILIDSPPTLGGWVMNIMCASDLLLIPLEASPWGLFGLANMFNFYSQAKKIAKSIDLLGVVITKADERKNYFKETTKTLSELGNVYVFENYIRVDSAVEWAQDNSMPVLAYKKNSRSAKEYLELTKEIIKNADR